ncbi:hypothetical protein CS8_059430 [Cupriavidus sp. 8B]
MSKPMPLRARPARTLSASQATKAKAAKTIPACLANLTTRKPRRVDVDSPGRGDNAAREAIPAAVLGGVDGSIDVGFTIRFMAASEVRFSFGAGIEPARLRGIRSTEGNTVHRPGSKGH